MELYLYSPVCLPGQGREIFTSSFFLLLLPGILIVRIKWSLLSVISWSSLRLSCACYLGLTALAAYEGSWT
jgi:hypothetical protein